jgi:F-type H+-transporting ATPase subunit b
MQINWFTVIAQIVNFLVLVWLMKRYLYKPILQAIDTREKKIAAELSDGKSKMIEADKEKDEYQKKNDAFDQQKKKMMDQATSDAEAERQKLLDAAKKEAAGVKQKLEEASKELQENLNEEISKRTQEEVFAITKKALSELASTNLEEQSVGVFIRNIKAITDRDKKQFVDAFHSVSAPVAVSSAFEIPEKEQKRVEKAIAGILGNDIKYEFKTDPKLISGIELATNGYKLSWSFSAYINSLEKSIAGKMSETHKAVKQ